MTTRNLRHAGFQRTEPVHYPGADGARSGDRVRPDGRHQHGPRRADGDGRLHHVTPLRCSSKSSCRPLFDVYFLIGIVLAFAVTFAFGYAMERGLIRFLYKRPLDTMLATWGLSLILQQVFRQLFGPKEVGCPR